MRETKGRLSQRSPREKEVLGMGYVDCPGERSFDHSALLPAGMPASCLCLGRDGEAHRVRKPSSLCCWCRLCVAPPGPAALRRRRSLVLAIDARQLTEIRDSRFLKYRYFVPLNDWDQATNQARASLRRNYATPCSIGVAPLRAALSLNPASRGRPWRRPSA
jgi:hypothetical protein